MTSKKKNWIESDDDNIRVERKFVHLFFIKKINPNLEALKFARDLIIKKRKEGK